MYKTMWVYLPHLSPAGCTCLHPPLDCCQWKCCPMTAKTDSSSCFYRTLRNWTGSDPASSDHCNTKKHGVARRSISKNNSHISFSFNYECNFKYLINNWLIQRDCKSRKMDRYIKRKTEKSVWCFSAPHLIGILFSCWYWAETAVLSESCQRLLDKSWIKYHFIPLCDAV